MLRKKQVIDTRTAIEIAVQALARRNYSKHEIKMKLLQQNCPDKILSEVMLYLTERRYLDDSALANSILRSMLQDGKYGQMRIMLKMRQRGIPESIIQDVMRNFDPALELNAAIAITRKKFSVFNDSVKPQIYRFLISRGFPSALISRVFDYLEYV